MAGFAAGAETEFFELGQNQRGEVVVEDRGLDVIGPQARILPKLPGTNAHLEDVRNFFPVIALHHLLIFGASLGRGSDHCRGILHIASALEGRDDEGLSPIALLAAVEQVQRLHDPAAFLVLLQGDGPLVEVGLGVVGCVFSIGDRDAPEILAGGAVIVHIALSEHGYPGRGSEQAEG